jgi:hypothetical protein
MYALMAYVLNENEMSTLLVLLCLTLAWSVV